MVEKTKPSDMPTETLGKPINLKGNESNPLEETQVDCVCWACEKPVSKTQKVCAACGSWLTWRRYLTVPNKFLAILVALLGGISVFITLYERANPEGVLINVLDGDIDKYEVEIYNESKYPIVVHENIQCSMAGELVVVLDKFDGKPSITSHDLIFSVTSKTNKTKLLKSGDNYDFIANFMIHVDPIMLPELDESDNFAKIWREALNKVGGTMALFEDIVRFKTKDVVLDHSFRLAAEQGSYKPVSGQCSLTYELTNQKKVKIQVDSKLIEKSIPTAFTKASMKYRKLHRK